MMVTTVLFDIGNVLTDDGHDTYLTHPEHGLLLAHQFPNTDELTRIAQTFREYAVINKTNAVDFWHDINSILKTSFTAQDIAAATRRARSINPEFTTVFKMLKNLNIAIGVISNSLDFLYKELSSALSLANYVDQNLFFLSHQRGVLKSNGLFELAAKQLEPSSTLIIEDRAKNAAYARKLGFKVADYSLDSGKSLLKSVTLHLGLPQEVS